MYVVWSRRATATLGSKAFENYLQQDNKANEGVSFMQILKTQPKIRET